MSAVLAAPSFAPPLNRCAAISYRVREAARALNAHVDVTVNAVSLALDHYAHGASAYRAIKQGETHIREQVSQ